MKLHETLKEKILAVLTFMGGIFAAIFYVLFQQKKAEELRLNAEIEKLNADIEQTKDEIHQIAIENERVSNAQEKYVHIKKENERDLHNAFNGGAAAIDEFLRKQAEQGAVRNSDYNSN